MDSTQALNGLIFLTIICWGGWGIFDKKALEQAGQTEVMLCLYILSVPFAPLAYLILNLSVPGWTISLNSILWTGLASLCYIIALLAYLQAMKRSEASLVLGITAGYPLVLQFIAFFFLKEALVLERLVGAVIIGAGVTLIGSSSKGEKEKGQTAGSRQEKKRVLILAAVATFCWGVWGAFDKLAIQDTHPLAVYMSQRCWDIVFLVGLLVFVFMRGKKPNLSLRRTWFYCGLSELSLGLGGLSYLWALSLSSASYVVTITGCYPLLMYLLALLLLKEQFNANRFIGILLVVLGGFVVQLTQNR